MGSEKRVIVRNINSVYRMSEIIESMPRPIVSFCKDEKSFVPSMTTIALNEDGVCRYIYKSSGSIDIFNDKIQLEKSLGIVSGARHD